jgi:formylglycine-generating enzyme required for sulfatase activity
MGKRGLLVLCLLLPAAALTQAGARAAELPRSSKYVNSIGMKLVRIEPGSFQMGQLKTIQSEVLPVFRGRGRFDSLKDGDYDERPIHTVRITRPFYMGVFEVTNFQYELFDPEHKKYRGKNGFSSKDDEAAAFVNWYDAMAFCRWLSDKEGLPYRLPTEAEWEYACRSGTTTNFHTGDVLEGPFLKKVTVGGLSIRPTDLTVGQTSANARGLYDMHGNIEEWCYDWYGPYAEGVQVDPVGYAGGDFKVTRGGSNGSDMYYLRSANRLGAIPESRNWVTGFRVALGELPKTRPPTPPTQRHQQNVVARTREQIIKGPDPDEPYFKGPLRYVNIPSGSVGPTYSCHNHCPAIVECPNGDLLTVWYTCHDEHGRELGQAASRLRWGADKWEEASLFFWAPDRNNHSPALWFDDNQTLYHFSAVSVARSRGRSALVMRTSCDSGILWSGPRMIVPEFAAGHLPSEPVFRMDDGTIALAVDGPKKNTELWMSRDEGLSWFNPGGDIIGVHGGVTQISDGRLFAMTRNAAIDGKMPICLSSDGGKSFTSIASEFPPIGGGQRLALLKLRSDELFFASFTNEGGPGIFITDAAGNQREVKGVFAALSLDDGRTWPYKRLVTDDGPARTIECTDGGCITMSASKSEYRGYLAVCQSLDGLVHLISSRNHFAFNLKWLMTKPPAPIDEPVRVRRVVETFTGPEEFDNEGWHDYKGPVAHFNGRGQYTIESGSHYNGINRLVGAGSFETTFELKNIRYNPSGAAGVTEGITLGFRDPLSTGHPTIFVYIKENAIDRREGDVHVRLSAPPTSVKMKFVYNKKMRQWRTFYGLDGAEPTTELDEPIKVKNPTSESCAAYILMSNGRVDLDRFEIKPIN